VTEKATGDPRAASSSHRAEMHLVVKVAVEDSNPSPNAVAGQVEVGVSGVVVPVVVDSDDECGEDGGGSSPSIPGCAKFSDPS